MVCSLSNIMQMYVPTPCRRPPFPVATKLTNSPTKNGWANYLSCQHIFVNLKQQDSYGAMLMYAQGATCVHRKVN